MTAGKTLTEKRIKTLLWFFIISLVVSGLTAFPLQWELNLASSICKKYFDEGNAIRVWILQVAEALNVTYTKYPFMGYGTDWLAFSHVIIAIFFLGPLKNPLQNIWTIKSGMIACILVIPLTFIAGEIRSIPMYWRLIDCSFGIIGIIPLMLVLREIKKLQAAPKEENKSNMLYYNNAVEV